MATQVDLALIHFPGGAKDNSGCSGVCKTAADRQATYRGLEQALALNLTRAIGVSNFKTETLHVRRLY
jgi:diketogulonate reductase-like aldo/keto reductase